MNKLRIGVIYGGRSGEHEVSLASAAAVFQNLDRERYEPVAILIEKDGRWALPDHPPMLMSAADVILRCCRSWQGCCCIGVPARRWP